MHHQPHPPRLSRVTGTALVGAATLVATALGTGAWVKDPPVPRGDLVGFFLVKAGVFHRSGRLKGTLSAPAKKRTCPSSQGARPSDTAWITHRLGDGERLTATAGTVLGGALAAELADGCFVAVELDVEPMPTPPDWLVPFLRAVRAALPRQYRLQVAVPPVTGHPTPGLRWTPEAARPVRDAIDGLDLMLYDTGAASAAAYQAIVADGAAFAAESSAVGKHTVLGLPAYRDRTPRHPLHIENLAVALEPLHNQAFLTAYCAGRIELAFYAYWTMDDGDRGKAKEIARRLRDCAAP